MAVSARSARVQVAAQPVGLAGAGPAATLVGRQGTARRITKAGDTYLRRMLFVGDHGGHPPHRAAPYLPALANQVAEPSSSARYGDRACQHAWAMMTSGERYREPAAA